MIGLQVAFIYWDNPFFSGFSGHRTGIEPGVLKYDPDIKKSHGVQFDQSKDNTAPGFELVRHADSQSGESNGLKACLQRRSQARHLVCRSF